MRNKLFSMLLLFAVIVSVLLAPATTMEAASGAKKASGKTTVGTVKWESIAFDENGTPELSWKEVSGATGYRIFRKTAGKGAKWERITTISSTVVMDTKRTEKSGTKIKYRVRAYYKDKNGKVTWGKYSATKTVELPQKATTLEICEYDFRYGLVVEITSDIIASERNRNTWDGAVTDYYSYDTEIIPGKTRWDEPSLLSGGYSVSYSFTARNWDEIDSENALAEEIKLGIDGVKAYLSKDYAVARIYRRTGVNTTQFTGEPEMIIVCWISLNQEGDHERTGKEYRGQVKEIFEEIWQEALPTIVKTTYVTDMPF